MWFPRYRYSVISSFRCIGFGRQFRLFSHMHHTMMYFFLHIFVQAFSTLHQDPVMTFSLYYHFFIEKEQYSFYVISTILVEWTYSHRFPTILHHPSHTYWYSVIPSFSALVFNCFHASFHDAAHICPNVFGIALSSWWFSHYDDNSDDGFNAIRKSSRILSQILHV